MWALKRFFFVCFKFMYQFIYQLEVFANFRFYDIWFISESIVIKYIINVTQFQYFSVNFCFIRFLSLFSLLFASTLFFLTGNKKICRTLHVQFWANDQFSNNFNYPKTTMHFNWANLNSKQINARANNYNQVRGSAQWNNVPIIFLGFTNTSNCSGNSVSNNKSCFQEIQRTEQQLDCGIIVSRVSVSLFYLHSSSSRDGDEEKQVIFGILL